MLGLTILLVAVNALYFANAELNYQAFTLALDQHIDQLADITLINFNKLVTNHKATGLSGSVFTCTAPGLYKFQVYSLTRTDTNLLIDLYKNDQIVASLWGHTPGDYAAAGNAIILDLATNDVVQVKSHSNQTVSIYGQPNEIYTTFSGVQLGAYQAQNGAQLAAFSVGLNQPLTVAKGQPVTYNVVDVDTENAYNVNAGTYTAPNGGIYYIHFFALAAENSMLWLELYHNADIVASIYGQTKGPLGEKADAGNTVILHLKQGDTIKVLANSGTDNSLYGAADQIYATFSGYELYTESAITNTRDDPKSYFSVGLSNGYTAQDGEKVIFDRVFTDPGDYDHVTGEYTAPEFGTYEFNYHALAENTTELYLDLYHNYRYINSAYSHTPADYATAGNSAVLELDKGDVVYIRSDGNNQLYGEWNEVYTTFSGCLLHTNSAKNPVVG